MTNVYGVWHGGNGYAQSHDWQDNLEWWPTMKAAKYSLWERWARENGYHIYATLDENGKVSRRREWILTPGVNREECYLDLFDIQSGEPYKRLTLGPRGGVRVENL